MSKESHYLDRYGAWAGNPKGFAPDYNRCAWQVFDRTFFRSYQCTRKCGHGPDGAYCKQHAKNLD